VPIVITTRRPRIDLFGNNKNDVGENVPRRLGESKHEHEHEHENNEHEGLRRPKLEAAVINFGGPLCPRNGSQIPACKAERLQEAESDSGETTYLL